MNKQPEGSGNSLDPEIVYRCPYCGLDNRCKVCHEHDEPRGKCSKCPKKY